MKWDFKRAPHGFSLLELLVGSAIAAILAGAMVTTTAYWSKAKTQAINGTQVSLIDNALRQYLRTYGSLPDLNNSEELSQWLQVYPSASGQPIPQGISYSVQRQYIPSTLSKGQSPGEVLLVGTGCSPIEVSTSCTLSLIP